MPWIQLKLNTTGANAEDLSDALMEAGSVSITFQDTHDTPVFEPLPGETRLWGDTDVIGLFDDESGRCPTGAASAAGRRVRA